MIEKIKRLGSETAIYGVSTILGRFLTFLLTPLYANLLVPGELGIVATLYAYIAFLNVVYHYGMEPAYMKYVSTLEFGTAKETFSVPFLSVAVSSIIFSGFLWLNDSEIALLTGVGSEYQPLIGYSALILLLDGLSYIPFAALRMERKASLFAAIRVGGIIVNVVSVVILLVNYRMGVEGIFIAGVISSGFTALMLVPTVVKNLTLRIPRRLYRALFSYGVPTLPAGLAAIILQVVDRPILEALTDARTVGIYQASYRLGIFMMLIVTMFEFAWRPFFFTHAKDPEAGKLFGRVLTYLLLIMCGTFLVLAFFLEAVVQTPLFFGYSLLPAEYWSGLVIVPVILLAYMLLGVSTVFSAGLYIQKQTARLPIVTIAGALLNVAANFFLIPRMGIMGAAIATLVSYALMAALMYFFSQKAFPVSYEGRRLFILVIATLAVYIPGVYVEPPVPVLLWRLLMVMVYLVGLYRLKFFEHREIAALRNLLKRGSSRGDSPPSSELSREDEPPTLP